MRATISKIHPIEYSRNRGSYIRVEFKLEDGSWAKTDLVPSFRNYERWRNLLKVGMDLDNITIKKRCEVDADSFPERYVKPAHGRLIKEIKEKIRVVEEITHQGRKTYVMVGDKMIIDFIRSNFD